MELGRIGNGEELSSDFSKIKILFFSVQAMVKIEYLRMRVWLGRFKLLHFYNLQDILTI